MLYVFLVFEVDAKQILSAYIGLALTKGLFCVRKLDLFHIEFFLEPKRRQTFSLSAHYGKAPSVQARSIPVQYFKATLLCRCWCGPSIEAV